MALSRGSEAEKKSKLACVKSGLVWCCDHSRIEERRGFQRVFIGKIGAE